ncbi:nuclease, partial [Methylobacterium sp. WL122]
RRAVAARISAAPAANAISGKAEVIDTATVRVAGKVLHLFGVEWVRGGQADELSKYLAGRAVTCTPVPGSENVSCTVEGRDLSEVVLFNGGGRASPEASPELVAAEDHARTERIGVWKR